MEMRDVNVGADEFRKGRTYPLLRKKVLLGALGTAAVVFVFFKFCLMPVQILGESMQPTYRNGTRHFLNRMAYWSKEPQRGDVIGLRSVDGDLYVKRIVAMPGETIEAKGGKTVINGTVLNEARTESSLPSDIHPSRLGEDEYFVIGDNRTVSVFGIVTRNRILGKIAF